MSTMKEEARQTAMISALALALGTVSTVFLVEFFHLPSAYIALSLASALSLLPVPSFQDFLLRLGSVFLGITSATLLLVTLAESPWIYFPLMGLITAFGYSFFLHRVGAGAAYLFSIYFAAMCIEGIHQLFLAFSTDMLLTALTLLLQSIIPIVVTYIVTLLLRRTPSPDNYPTLQSPLAAITSITLVLWTATLVAFALRTDQPARLIIASIAGITALQIEQSTASFKKRMLGYILGALLSIAFVVAIVSSTNDLGIYLLGLGFLFGLLEWLAHCYSAHQLLFRSISTMFAYSALMLPAPDSNLHVSIARITSSFLGFSIAILIFSLVLAAKKITSSLLQFNVNEN